MNKLELYSASKSFVEDDSFISCIKNEIENLKEANSQTKLVVSFCGNFTSGKTSLINNLLDCNYKFPTGYIPITKFITRIEYAPNFQASYYDNDNQRKDIPKKSLNDFICGKSIPQNGCKEIIVGLPSKILSSKIVFIDTPGLSDEYELDEISKRAMHESDLTVLCFAANRPPANYDKEVLIELENSLSNFCIAITYWDQVQSTDSEKLKNYVKNIVGNLGFSNISTFYNKNIFYTWYFNEMVGFDGLDDFIKLLNNRDNFDLITKTSKQKRIKASLEKNTRIIDNKIDYATELYNSLYPIINSEYEHKKSEHQLKQQSLQNDIDAYKLGFAVEIDNFLKTIEYKFNKLEAAGNHNEFPKESKEILKQEILNALEFIKNSKIAPYIENDIGMSVVCQQLTNLVEKYRVPKITENRVKNRGILMASAFSIVATIISHELVIDDGYDITYSGYAKNTFNDVKKFLIPKIYSYNEEMLKIICKINITEMQPLKDKTLTSLNNRLNKLKSFKQEVEKELSSIM